MQPFESSNMILFGTLLVETVPEKLLAIDVTFNGKSAFFFTSQNPAKDRRNDRPAGSCIFLTYAKTAALPLQLADLCLSPSA